MPKDSKNSNLHNASKAKSDEFFTKLRDIESELYHYRNHFKDKVVFCNCDDPETSNFWKYFELNFNVLGLKRLVATHYEVDKPSYMLEIARDENADGIFDSKDIRTTPLKENGDFRSPECVEILKQSDIVVTNEPFSLFREYVAQLIAYNKKFVIIGSQNAIAYKEIFPLIQKNLMWLGHHSGDMEFVVPDYYEPRETRFRVGEDGTKYRSLGNICWYTNLDIPKRHERLILYKTYQGNEDVYPKYDTYDAINVDKVADIPMDYDGIMGVPVTFMSKYNPDQFELIGIDRYVEDNPHPGYRFTIKGREIYARILIRRK